MTEDKKSQYFTSMRTMISTEVGGRNYCGLVIEGLVYVCIPDAPQCFSETLHCLK